MEKFSAAHMNMVEMAQQKPTLNACVSQENTEQILWSGIGFLLKEHRLVCAVNEVAEVLVVPKITRIPGVQCWMQGVANVRGRLLPIVDLGLFLSKSVTVEPAPAQRLLVVEKGPICVGIIVDDVLGHQHCQTELWKPAEIKNAELLSYLAGEFSDSQGKLWYVFSMERLLANPQFLNAAL